MGISLGTPSTGLQVSGNGAVYHSEGQLYGRDHYAVPPLRYTDPDGLSGPPILWLDGLGYQRLGELLGADGTLTTDQVIEMKGAIEYMIDRVVFCHATATPVAMVGGIYTNLSKGGQQVVAASQAYTALSDTPYNALILTPTEAIRAAPYLYLALTTPNGAPVTFDVLVFGKVIKSIKG